MFLLAEILVIVTNFTIFIVYVGTEKGTTFWLSFFVIFKPIDGLGLIN